MLKGKNKEPRTNTRGSSEFGEKEEEGELDNNLEGRRLEENDIIQKQRKAFQIEEWSVMSNVPKKDKGLKPLIRWT